MLSETFFIQLVTVISVFLFVSSMNLLILWYLAGIYLVLLGLLLFINDGDILVGFLWVIDLGVGLIFFIFILHYSAFLHQKVIINKNHREIMVSVFLSIAFVVFYLNLIYPVDTTSTAGFDKTWIFLITWIDYYVLYFSPIVTDLNLLHEVYFVNNNFEFLLINFFLFYGIVSAILLSFLIKHVFTKLALPQFKNLKLYRYITSTFFIRNQNYLKQQSTSAGERVWVKKRSTRL